MSAYIKTRADQKKKLNKDYNDRLFTAASLVLPSVVLQLGDEASPAEAVDAAVLLARNLLTELGYYEIDGKVRNEKQK